MELSPSASGQTEGADHIASERKNRQCHVISASHKMCNQLQKILFPSLCKCVKFQHPKYRLNIVPNRSTAARFDNLGLKKAKDRGPDYIWQKKTGEQLLNYKWNGVLLNGP